MTADRIDQCLDLLCRADDMLMGEGELLIAAHLSMAIELLAARQAVASTG